jgi:Ribbon-helix-helix protein, copG family
MPYFKKQLNREQKKTIKRRYDEHALKNVISLRISDEELEMLTRISKNSSKSVSEIMRDAFKSWQASSRRLCLDM